jgi:heme exporter protein D
MAAINHLGFIVAAYAAAIVVVGALVAWVMLDYRALRRTLADFDRRGISRRSGSEPPPPVLPAMERARGDV